MGSCCFTPRRSQFLWWYWLVLASIVGIPMLLAAWYVAGHPYADDDTRQKLGKKAAAIFWYSSMVTAVLVFLATWFIYRSYHPAPVYSFSPSVIDTLRNLILAYLGGVALLTAGDDRGGKRKTRILAWLGAVLVLFLSTVSSLASVAEFCLMLATCAFVAHFFGLFAEDPTPKTARHALGVLVLGAFLFWGSAKYGKLGNLYLNRLVQGKLPE